MIHGFYELEQGKALANKSRHITEVWLSVHWAQVEPTPGRYDFSLLDKLMAQAHETKVKFVFRLLCAGKGIDYGPQYRETPQWIVDAGLTMPVEGTRYKEPIYWRNEYQFFQVRALLAAYDHILASPYAEDLLALQLPLCVWGECTNLLAEFPDKLRPQYLKNGYSDRAMREYPERQKGILVAAGLWHPLVTFGGGFMAPSGWNTALSWFLTDPGDWFGTAQFSEHGITEVITRNKIMTYKERGKRIVFHEGSPAQTQGILRQKLWVLKNLWLGMQPDAVYWQTPLQMGVATFDRILEEEGW